MTRITTNQGLDAVGAAQVAAQGGDVNKAQALGSHNLTDKKAIDKAAGGFEALLLHQMMKSMWATVDTSGLLGEDSNQAQFFRDMFNEAVADNIAKGRGIGIKSFVGKELAKQHGSKTPQTPDKGQGGSNNIG